MRIDLIKILTPTREYFSLQCELGISHANIFNMVALLKRCLFANQYSLGSK